MKRHLLLTFLCSLPLTASAQNVGNATMWTTPSTIGGSASVLYVEAFTGWGGTATQNRTALQAAIGALPAAGGTIILPAGTFQLDTTITVNVPVTLIGQGGNNNTGTQLKITSATADMFRVTVAEPVHFRDFTMSSTLGRTAGAYIKLAGNGSFTVIEDLFFVGHYRGIEAADASNTTIRYCQFIGGVSSDIFWNNSPAYADAGAASIVSNIFVGGATNKTAIAIHIRSGGGPRILGNKFLGKTTGVPGLSMAYAAQLYLDWSVADPSSIMEIANNSFDDDADYKVLLNSASGQGGYSQIQIVGNQFIGGDVVTVGLEPGAANPGALRDITITGNTFAAKNTGAAGEIFSNGAYNVEISGNVFRYGGGSPRAIVIGPFSAETLVGVNQFDNAASWLATITNSSSTTRIDDRVGMAFANLPATAANGSLVYCSTCTSAAICTGGGTGAFAKRLNGSWVCN